MISAATLGLLAVAGASTSMDLYNQQAEYKLQKQQLDNQLTQQENAAIFQSTQKIDQMARSISSQNAYAGANGMSNSSGYRNNLFYEGYEGNKDLDQIDSNLAAKQAKNESQQLALKSKKDMSGLKSVLDFGGNVFNTMDFGVIGENKTSTPATSKTVNKTDVGMLKDITNPELLELFEKGAITEKEFLSLLKTKR